MSNSPNGDVGSSTLFHYSERDGVIWGEYSGGAILKGQLVGVKLSDDRLDFRYCHVNEDRSMKTGICSSRIFQDPNGKLRLEEKWKWTSGDGSEGESVIVEV